MHTRSLLALAGLSLAFSACGDATQTAVLESDDQKASYGIGLNMGANLAPTSGRLDMPAFLQGIEDAMAEREPAVPADQIQTALDAFSQSINEAMQAEREAEGAENRAAGEAYLAENAARDGVQVTESGLQYEVLEEGAGDPPTREQQVKIHYRGTLVDGTEFDSSLGGEPAQFGVSGVIPGFTEALLLMRPGSKYRVVIPSDLAYGAGGSGRIGPNSTLIFEIELLEII